MFRQPKPYYLLSLFSLAVFLVATAFWGVSAHSQPVLFEGLALLIFLPLTVALCLDWRFNKLFVWRFIVKVVVSLFCLAHFVLFVALIGGYIHV